MTAASHTRPTRRVLVWDLPTRLFHWLLAALVTTSFVTGWLEAFELHFLSGYAILTLVLFRLAWGVVGSQSARFGHFVKGPAAALRHIAHLLGRAEEPPVLGHNPLGGAMVLVLLAAVLVQAGSGLFTTDDVLTDGPLVALADSATVGQASSLHRSFNWLLLGLVGVHVLAVIAYLAVRRDNLIVPMITGRKRVPADAAVTEPRRASPWLALGLLAAAAAVVAAVLSSV